MTLRAALLTFRIQRFETVVIVGAAVASVVVSATVIWIFTSGGYSRCLTEDAPTISALCQSPIALWLSRIARLSLGVVPVFPLVAGLLAGGPIVARELESGTARLAWSLGPSRLRWFVQRALPILVMTGVAALAVGLTAEALLRLTSPQVDLENSFLGFRFRGPLLAVEAVVVATVALAIGSILGRMVPTIILSLILVGGLVLAIDKVERSTLLAEATVADAETYFWDDSNLSLESRLRFPDGQILSYEEAIRTHPEIDQGWDETSGIRSVELYIPGSRYHDVERREGLALGGVAIGFIALAAVAVIRRRPR